MSEEEIQAAAEARQSELRLVIIGCAQRSADVAAELSVTQMRLAKALAQIEELKKSAPSG